MSTLERKEILITDLPGAVVEGNLSEVRKYEHWLIEEWEIDKIGPCRGLDTRKGDSAGPATIKLRGIPLAGVPPRYSGFSVHANLERF